MVSTPAFQAGSEGSNPLCCSINFKERGSNMDINREIERTQKNIEGYKRMLDEMPENTFLGRLCIKAYLKLKNLLNMKNSCSN